MSLFKALTRILAIVGKELVSIVRRPGALLSLVLGPFLIMALFGLGYSGYRRPLDTVVVIPPSTGLSTDPKTYQDVAGEGLQVVQITPDENAAMAELTTQKVDVVVVAPADAQQQFQAGKRTQIVVRVNALDTPWCEADVRAVARLGPSAILFPKIATEADATRAGMLLDAAGAPAGTELWCMIETPLAILNVRAIAFAAALPGTRMTTWVVGTNDLVKEMRGRHVPGREPLVPMLTFARELRANIIVELDLPATKARNYAPAVFDCEFFQLFCR